jgi:hypothetical protein
MLPTEFLTLLTTRESAAYEAIFMNTADGYVVIPPTVLLAFEAAAAVYVGRELE